MSSRVKTHPTGKCAEPELIVAAAGECALELATTAEIFALRDICAALFDEPIASAATFAAANERTRSCVFGYRPRGMVEGFLAILPLRVAGHELVKREVFDGVNLDLDMIAVPGEAPDALYAWGIAATSKKAAYAIVMGYAHLQNTLFWGIPKYTNAATDTGVKITFDRMGFTPLSPGSRIAMYPARTPVEAVR